MDNTLITRSQDALTLNGISEIVVAAAIFSPRHHYAGALTGGLIGTVLGDAWGGLGEAVASVAGAEAGSALSGRASGMPGHVILMVTDRSIFCFTRAFAGGRPRPDRLVMRLEREATTVRVRQRPSFRIIELTDSRTRATTAFEGHRFAAHAGSVVAALRAPAATALAE